MNVLITGGNFFNAGAEAMTFTAISEIRKRNKNTQIVILCSTDENSCIINEIAANVLEYHQLAILNALGGGYRLTAKLKNYIKKYVLRRNNDNIIFEEYQRIIEKTDLIIDVSGLVLSHRKYVKSNLDLYYMFIIKLASKKKIPIILMPQSFGPFEYTFGLKRVLMNYLMKKYLPYPMCIYTREQGGYDLLKKRFNLTNLVPSTDMVLQTHEIIFDLVFKTEKNFKKLVLQPNTVAIIPHVTQFRVGDNKYKFLKIYKEIINLLINNGKEVLILYHADADRKAADLIADAFTSDDKVKFLNEKINSISYCEIIKQCQFAIAGRYHSIVHAYKQNVPCITFGWAEKYEELFSLMKQEKYYFYLDDIDLDKGLNVVKEMCSMYPIEKKIIAKRLEDIQKDNCFTILDDLCKQES